MSATPETIRPEVPDVVETQEQFVVPEVLQQSTGVKVVQKNFTAQVKDDSGKPVITTPPTQVVSVTPPYDPATLTTKSKGKITEAVTWLAVFWLRIIKKATHFGWNVVGKN